MNKQAIIDQLSENYTSFVNYINSLADEEYSQSIQHKWSPAQQLEHIVLCIRPLVQVFSMDKTAIGQAFGCTDKPGRSYDVLLSDYLIKLTEGGKAPERYVPAITSPGQRNYLCETLTKLVKELCAKIETFTEEELDTLLVPHPLLGNITLREMLYNATYHVKHHQSQIQEGRQKSFGI